MTTETIERPKIQTETQTKEPGMYNVYILDDNKTTFEFVIKTLMAQFHMSFDRSKEVTLAVHQEGRGLAGTFPFEIAETKADETHKAAQAEGFPLKAMVTEA